MTDLLAMTATVVDKASGPLADIHKNMRRLAQGTTSDLRSTNDVLYEFGRNMRNAAVTGMQMFGSSALAVAGALTAAGVAMRNLARDSLPMKRFAEEVHLSTSRIADLKEAALALGGGDVQQNLVAISDLMRNYHDQTAASIEKSNELKRMNGAWIAATLEGLSKLKDTESQLEGLSKLFDRLADRDKPIVSQALLGSREAYRMLGREARYLLRDLQPLLAVPEKMALDYTKSLMSIDRSFENLKRTILIGLMPTFTEWTDAFGKWVSANKDDVAKGAVDAFRELAAILKTTRQELEALANLSQSSPLGWLADRLGPEPKKPLAPYRLDPSWWQGAKDWLGGSFDPLGLRKGGATGNWPDAANQALQDPTVKEQEKGWWRQFLKGFINSGFDLGLAGGGVMPARFQLASLGGFGGGGLAGGAFGGGGMGGAPGRGLGDIGGGGLGALPRGRGGGGGAAPDDSTGQGLAGSEYLKARRQRFADELRDNPETKRELAALLTLEHESDAVPVVESLMNRMEYTGGTLKRGMHSGFYGPMNRGQVPGRMRVLDRDPKRQARMEAAIDAALAGSNLIKGATDQGSGNDPNVNWPGGRIVRHGEVYNDWGGGPGGHAGARRFRELQQARVNQEAAKVSHLLGTEQAARARAVMQGILSSAAAEFPPSEGDRAGNWWLGRPAGREWPAHGDQAFASPGLNRAIAAQTAAKIEGGAKLDINVMAPKGTAVKYSRIGNLFDVVEMHRSQQMAISPDVVESGGGGW